MRPRRGWKRALPRPSNTLAGWWGDGGGPDAVTRWLDSHAQDNKTAMAQEYQAPADAPQSVTDAVTGSTGPLNAASRVGQFAVRKVAENAGSIIPNLALGIALPEEGLMRAGVAGYDYLQNLGGVTAAKQQAGIDTTNAPSTLDMANAAGQTALMAANPLGRGLSGSTALGRLAAATGRVAGSAVDGAAKGAVQSAANDTGALVQGGDLGADPAGTILSHALDAGVAGAATGGPLAIARESAGAVQGFLTTRKAGPNMQAFASETAPWNAAVNAAAQRLQQADSSLSPDEVQQRAYVLAQQGTPNNPGVAPPSFDKLSPAAQNGMAELAAVQMYQKARQAITDGMGRPDADPAPAQVFKNVLATVTDNLTDTATLAQQAGILSRDDAGTLKDAHCGSPQA